MHVEATPSAVEDQLPKLALEVGLHVQELEAEHVRVDDRGVGGAVPDRDRFVDEIVSLRGLFRDSMHGD